MSSPSNDQPVQPLSKKARGERGARAPVVVTATTEVLKTQELLTRRLREEALNVWHQTPTTTTTSSSETTTTTDAIPNFKVGTLEMYRRFPEAYDSFMSCHNCDELQRYLHDLLKRVEKNIGQHMEGINHDASSSSSSSRPSLSVADMGCGTGRIERMLAKYAAVDRIYAYDNEPAMLRRCIINTVAAVKEAGTHSHLSLLPTASSSHEEAICITDGSSTVGASSSRPLWLCARPYAFEHIRVGCLEASAHPRCHAIVCAWSLSYVMRAQWGEDRWHGAVDAVVRAMKNHLLPGGVVVVIETLGNSSPQPTRHNTLSERLEQHHGFARHWLRTDYEFGSVEEAVKSTRFFFGEAISATMAAESSTVLMECSGVWTWWRDATPSE